MSIRVRTRAGSGFSEPDSPETGYFDKIRVFEVLTQKPRPGSVLKKKARKTRIGLEIWKCRNSKKYHIMICTPSKLLVRLETSTSTRTPFAKWVWMLMMMSSSIITTTNSTASRRSSSTFYIGMRKLLLLL